VTWSSRLSLSENIAQTPNGNMMSPANDTKAALFKMFSICFQPPDSPKFSVQRRKMRLFPALVIQREMVWKFDVLKMLPTKTLCPRFFYF
jgi:hypothetical protein